MGPGKPPKVYRSKQGTPQGGVISPLLANLYLHWINRFVQERLERHLKRRSQRPYRKTDTTWYGQLQKLGLVSL